MRSGGNRAQMVTAALVAGEGQLTADGALAVTTGTFTGRSPKDKYIVRDALTEPACLVGECRRRCAPRSSICCSRTCSPTPRAASLYHEQLSAGADPAFRMAVSVVTETAWHALFIRNLLIRDTGDGAPMAATILHLPGLQRRPGAARHADRAR